AVAELAYVFSEDDFFSHCLSPASRLALRAAEGQQRDIARTLDCPLQQALVLGAQPGMPAGQNLPAVAQELAQHIGIAVADVVNLVDAEVIDFLAAVEPPSAGSASGSAGAAAAATAVAVPTVTVSIVSTRT